MEGTWVSGRYLDEGSGLVNLGFSTVSSGCGVGFGTLYGTNHHGSVLPLIWRLSLVKVVYFPVSLESIHSFH